LANQGYDVKIFEKKNYVGGRTSSMQIDSCTFDLGPTFFHYKEILEEIFQQTGRKLDDYVKLFQLNPMYDLIFDDDKRLTMTQDQSKMVEQLKEMYPGNEQGYLDYMTKEKVKFNKLKPTLQKPFNGLTDYVDSDLVKALPYLDAHQSIWDKLGSYFDHDDLKIAFAFQAKYLGMSPWQAPGLFTILSYLEHGGGVYHAEGGLNQLTKAMARCIEEDNGQIYTSCGVKEIIVENDKAIGVELENGKKVFADEVIINADFAHAMSNIVDKKHRKKYSDENLKKKGYSCSTFMLYLSLDTLLPLPHHSIYIAKNYKQNVNEIVEGSILSDDPSFYIQNACVTDHTLAPAGKSAFYILVPVPNVKIMDNWDEIKTQYRNKIIKEVSKRIGHDLEKHITSEKVITPTNWKNDYDVYRGAVFNLKHNLGQMLHKRPKNKFEEFNNCYLVGGGTHPGSGLPTIFESGRITAKMILQKQKPKVPFKKLLKEANVESRV
jgi:phytoene desaturase